jgi:hypothetical protein
MSKLQLAQLSHCFSFIATPHLSHEALDMNDADEISRPWPLSHGLAAPSRFQMQRPHMSKSHSEHLKTFPKPLCEHSSHTNFENHPPEAASNTNSCPFLQVRATEGATVVGLEESASRD